MKKITATLLALLLLLSLSVTAFAADTPTGTGSITVKGAETGKTYTLYKVFDLETVNAQAAYSIPGGDVSVTDSGTTTTKSRAEAYEGSTNFSSFFDTTTDTTSGKTYVTVRSGATNLTAVSEWGKGAMSYFVLKEAQTAQDQVEVKFENLEPGYYFLESKLGTTVGTMAMIKVVNNEAVEVIEKNSTPGWGPGDDAGKKANDKTYYAGEEITYTLTYKNATNYAMVDRQGKQVTKYYIKDILPNGLDYVENSLKVWVETTEVTNQLTTEDTTITNGFFVSIPWTDTATVGDKTVTTSKYTKNPSTITVEYKAIMGLSTTENFDSYKNIAQIYPDTNKNPLDETKKEETVYTGTVRLNKKAESLDGAALNGAKFKVKVGGADSTQYLKLENDKYTLVDFANATVFETGKAIKEGAPRADGAIILTGLKAGTYIFTEVEAPVGYALPEEARRNLATFDLHMPTGTETLAATLSISQNVVNTKAAAMPETGGMGTTMFYVVGSLLAVTALVFLVTQKRMRSVQ